MSLLDLEAVRVRRGGRRVVEAVSLEIRAGEVVGLIGPNGAGKSSLIRAALGLLPAEGAIRLGGAPLAALGPAERAAAAAYLPQEREVAWALAAEAVAALGRYARSGAGPAADAAAVERALARADVLPFRQRPVTELSGGERARVLLARALAQEAPLLIADEPTAGLDPAHQIAVMETFAALAAEGGGVLVTLHDLTRAARHCDRLLLMHEGRLVAQGPPEAVLTPAILAATYGVTVHLARDAGGLVIVPTGRIRA